MRRVNRKGLSSAMQAVWLTLAPSLVIAQALLGQYTVNAGSRAGSNTNTVLETQGSHFCLNDRPTFLLGISYYAALGASQENIRRDLDDFQRDGFNWLRVWATWAAFAQDVSAVDGTGAPRQPFLGKLQWLVGECDRRGLVVDVTLSRQQLSPNHIGSGSLPDFDSHQHALATLINALRDHRNWYLDLANEHDVRDARFVSLSELQALRDQARQLAPQLLVTASLGGHDLAESDVRDCLVVAGLDFLAPHRPRDAGSSGQTETQTRSCLAWEKSLKRIAPILYQEPFRRGYGAWQPGAEDFLTDLRGALAGGAAGWCFHNGSEARSPDHQPRRSFDLRARRLFDQLDPQERKVVAGVKAVVAGANLGWDWDAAFATPREPQFATREAPPVQAIEAPVSNPQGPEYYPPPESAGGWRTLEHPDEIRRLGGADPAKLVALKEWLLQSDDRDFAAVVIRHGYIVLEVERGNSARTDCRRVASVSKAICATVLAIASEQSQHGLTPRKMTFDDPAFDFIPWAQPLSDPRKARITVKQLLNHTSGICPEATGAPNDGSWEYILGLTGDERTAKLAFDPGTACGYSTHALAHASLVCETVTGMPYDQFAIQALFKPLGIEHWWFQYYDGGKNIGRHPSHGLGMPARDLARIAYCMLHEGRWKDRQVIPQWFVQQTAEPTHHVTTPELRWKFNPQIFSHGWELPARHWPQGPRSGEGIPRDARDKPGSGGQLIGFVPGLDLVVTRQTGASGEWGFEEYLRQACATALGP